MRRACSFRVSFTIVLLVVLLNKSFETAGKAVKESPCEKKCHKSLSTEQKKQLCGSSATGNFLGPAICGAEAKDVLHLKFDDILELCSNATSSSPVECLKGLDIQARSKYGIELCRGATSVLPVDCYKRLSAFRGRNIIKSENIFEFCNGVDDAAPIQCLEAVYKHSIMPINTALSTCQRATNQVGLVPPRQNTWARTLYSFLFGDDSGRAVALCIKEIKPHINGAMGLTAAAALDFCVEINAGTYYKNVVIDPEYPKSPPVECFLHAKNIKFPSGSNSFTVAQRLSLCTNAVTPLGPVNCTECTVTRVPIGEPKTKLTTEDYATLCQGAIGRGPGDCFVESIGLGTIAERLDMCTGAIDASPSRCYRRTEGAFRKTDRTNNMLLCIGAASEDPAFCAINAPNYLSPLEKVDLCTNTPSGKSNDPITCITNIPSFAKLFQNAPKKGLGYNIENILLPTERTSRQLLVELCSFTMSMDPLAAAECLKRSPKTLNHDDVAKMCTNISSSEMLQHIQHCHRSLPKEWRSEEASVLCGDTTSQEHALAVVRCATFLSKHKGREVQLDHGQIAQLCRTEKAKGMLIDGPVVACAKELIDKHSTITTSSGAYLLTGNPTLLLDVCSGANSTLPGKCVVKMASYPSSKMLFDGSVASTLCREGSLPVGKDSMTLFPCFEGSKSRMIVKDDVVRCAEQKDRVHYLKLIHVESEDESEEGGIKITAGKRFSILFEVQTQWRNKFIEHTRHPTYIFSASVNANNAQGAILWGLRSNSSSAGVLQLSSLVVSLPGQVDFKISYREMQPNGEVGDLITLDVFKLVVKEDPVIAQLGGCMYIFKEPHCPTGLSVEDWEADFPRIRSYNSPARYMDNAHCQPLLHTLHVDSYLSVDGSMWVDYRMGIESIWTGIGLPLMEMGAADRLDLDLASRRSIQELDKNMTALSQKEKRSLAKDIRRAYYRKSLQWHPDRWSGLGMYTVAVKGAFELINEAYNTLSGNKNADKVGKNSEYE